MEETTFSTYVWMWSKRFGSEIYSTWRKELFSSVAVTVIGGAIGYHLNDANWWPALKSALLANGLLLVAFGVFHLVRTAWLIHKDAVSGGVEPLPWKFGIVGLVALASVLGSVVVLGVWILKKPTPVTSGATVPSTIAKDVEVSRLRGELDLARKKKCPAAQGKSDTASNCPAPTQQSDSAREFPSPMFIDRRDAQTRNAQIAMNAFTYLLTELPAGMGSLSSGCHITITSPNENAEVARTVYELSAATRCNAFYQRGSDLQPEIEERALRGAEKDAVIIHAPKSGRNDNFSAKLNNIFHVIRKYDALDEGKPSETIWIQIGPGFPWQKTQTQGSSIGQKF